MKRIVVPMPRYTYVLLMSFSNYKIFQLRLIHSKTSQTQAQISHNCCFYISLSLILIMIHFPFLLLFLTLKYTLHNVTPYSLSLLNFNVRIHLVHTYIAAVSNHMYITSKFSSNGSHHHICLMMLWKINLLGSSTTMCTLILSRIRSNSITLFTSGTFHQKNEPKKPMINLDDFLKKQRMRWLERVVYTRVENKFCVSVEEIPPLLPSSMPGNAVYNTEADKSSVYLESNSKPSGAYMYTLNFSFMSD